MGLFLFDDTISCFECAVIYYTKDISIQLEAKEYALPMFV